MSIKQARHRDNVPAARDLRTRETPAEVMLWDALRGRRLAGFKFRRQHPVGPFVVDFCCPDRRLAIEIDGAVHDTQREYDSEREDILQAAGYHILRFTNDTVHNDFLSVLEAIRAAAESQPPRPAQAIPRTAGW